MSGRVPEEVGIGNLVANKGSNKAKVWDAFHNIIMHPVCGIVWSVSDMVRAVGFDNAAKHIAKLGVRIHNIGFIPGSPYTHAQIAHVARDIKLKD